MDDDRLWKALSDPTRRAILDNLASSAQTTGELVDTFPNLSRFAVMKHLGVLESAGLVSHTRKGRQRFNHLNAVPLRKVYERWVGHLEDGFAASLLRVGDLAEQSGKESDMNISMRQVEIHQEHHIQANVDKVWTILTTQIGEWWSVPFRMFRERSEMTLDLRPGGGLVEQKGEAFVYWALITAVHPGKSVELDGLNGPVQGRFTFSITEESDGCLLKIDHSTIEVDDGEPEGYSGGWEHLANGVKELAEA